MQEENDENEDFLYDEDIYRQSSELTSDFKVNPNKNANYKDIDFELVKRLAMVMTSKEDMLVILGVSVSTLERRIREAFDCTVGEFIEKYQCGTKANLRKAQVEAALRGSERMQIHLGKNWLGQSDSIRHDITGSMHMSLVDYINGNGDLDEQEED